MKSRFAAIALCLGSLLFVLHEAAQAGGPGSGGGGGTVPQIAGTWYGQYTYTVFAFGLVPPGTNATRQAIMDLVEDSAGNLGGRFCLGVESPGCFPLKGRVQSNGAVQLEFSSGGGATFKLNGGITGTMTCVDASVGQIIAGTFQVREGLGTFSFNNCP